MNTKIDVSVKCPNPKCDAIINFRKKFSLQVIDVPCPKCKSQLHMLFNINENPQSCKVSIVSKESDGVEEDNSLKKKDTIYKKDKNKTPHNIYEDFDEDEVKHIKSFHKKRRLKSKIYLTHCKLFGLIKDRYPLSEGKTIVGRFDDDFPSDISLKGDNTISRQSIAISIEADEYGFDYKLKVLNATNTIKVNDRKVKVGEEVYLEFGDIIKLGNSKLIFDNK